MSIDTFGPANALARVAAIQSRSRAVAAARATNHPGAAPAQVAANSRQSTCQSTAASSAMPLAHLRRVTHGLRRGGASASGAPPRGSSAAPGIAIG